MRLSFHRWPTPGERGGQQVTRFHTGVLCMDEDTGVAVYVCEHRSQLKNQQLAEERVKLILDKVSVW